jgi:hypothetical protein
VSSNVVTQVEDIVNKVVRNAESKSRVLALGEEEALVDQ